MKPSELTRYERPACASCGAMAPECLVPRGVGAIPCCWLCAHAIVEHGAALGAPEHCDCAPEEIYPPDVLSRRPTHLRIAESCVPVEPVDHWHGTQLQIVHEPEPFDRVRSMAISRGMRAARRARERS